MIKIADNFGNFIIVTSNDVIKLSLVKDVVREPRKIGVLDRKDRMLYVERNREKHLFKKGNAYGFNEKVIRDAKAFDHVMLHDEYGDYKIPREEILKKGEHLFFKEQGFELQIFLSLREIKKHQVKTKGF